MQSIRQLNRSITTTNNPLSSLLVLARTNDAFLHHGFIVTRSNSWLCSPFIVSRQQFHSIGFPGDALKNATKSPLVVTTRTASTESSPPPLPSQPPSPLPPPSLEISSPLPSLPNNEPTKNPPAPDTRVYWTIEENTRMLELMRDNVWLGMMASHFPDRSKGAVDRHAGYLRQLLGTIGASPADLNKNDIMTAMVNRAPKRPLWSKEQDEMLQTLYKEHGPDWKLIATIVSEGRGRQRNGEDQQRQHQEPLIPQKSSQWRTAKECDKRIQDPEFLFFRGPWSKEELDRLCESIEEVKEEYRSRGQRFMTLGVNATGFDGNNENSDDGTGGSKTGTKFVNGFWISVAEKVKTRNAWQSCSIYDEMIYGQCTEEGEGRNTHSWTIVELEALRHWKAGISKDWEHSEDVNKSNEGNKISARRIFTEKERRHAQSILLQTQSKVSIGGKVHYLRNRAKQHRMSIMDYLDMMITLKRRMGHWEEQSKVQRELIAARLNNSNDSADKKEV